MGKKKIESGEINIPQKQGITMAQRGIIRALKARGCVQNGTIIPIEMTCDKHKILITENAAEVKALQISIPLGKGAIIKLMAALPK